MGFLNLWRGCSPLVTSMRTGQTHSCRVCTDGYSPDVFRDHFKIQFVRDKLSKQGQNRASYAAAANVPCLLRSALRADLTLGHD